MKIIIQKNRLNTEVNHNYDPLEPLVRNVLVYPSYNMITPSYFMTLEQEWERAEKVFIFEFEEIVNSIKINKLVARIKGNIGLHFLQIKDYTISLPNMVDDVADDDFFVTVQIDYSTNIEDLATQITYRLEPLKDSNLLGTPILSFTNLQGVISNVKPLDELSTLDCRCGVRFNVEDAEVIETKKYGVYKVDPSTHDTLLKLPNLSSSSCKDNDMAFVKILNRGHKQLLVKSDTNLINGADGSDFRVLDNGITEFYYDCEKNDWISTKDILTQMRHSFDMRIGVVAYYGELLTDYYIEEQTITPIPKERNILIVGQSNIGGHAESRDYTSSNNTLELGIDGKWKNNNTHLLHFETKDPLSQSYTLELVDKLNRVRLDISSFRVANISVGGTSVTQWANQEDIIVREDDRFRYRKDSLHERISFAVTQFHRIGKKLSYILYHQGETDNIDDTTKEKYKRNFREFQSRMYNKLGYEVPIYLCIASYVHGEVSQAVVDAQIELIAENPLILMGVNTDALGSEYRRVDNLHLSQIGVDKVISLWLEVLKDA